MTKVFIDGSAGTTGLRIYERLGSRTDIELIRLPEELRKDDAARRDALNRADIAFLCLPDAAAIEAAKMVCNSETVIIDTSTAHRTDDEWIYGFPELHGYREKIATSKRIANPGCHAGGFIALVAPLTESGIIPKDAPLSCFSLTGYSGGGKKMIEEYESAEKNKLLKAPRMYGLPQAHKHLPEMTKICKLDKSPVFCPVVSSFYSGMEVTVPLHREMINGDIDDIKKLYKDYYNDGVVHYSDDADSDGLLSAAAFALRDDMEVSVFGNGDRLILCARFDNLGKGASGAAVQNMNIVLGIDEKTGLTLG